MSASREHVRLTGQASVQELLADVRELTERVAALDRLMEAKFVTFDVLVRSQAEKVALALTAADKAVTKAEMATEKRFESVNEFRASLADQTTSLVTKTEFGAKVDSLAEKLGDITDRMNRAEGKGAGAGALWGWIVGALGVLSAVVVMANALFK